MQPSTTTKRPTERGPNFMHSKPMIYAVHIDTDNGMDLILFESKQEQEQYLAKLIRDSGDPEDLTLLDTKGLFAAWETFKEGQAIHCNYYGHYEAELPKSLLVEHERLVGALRLIEGYPDWANLTAGGDTVAKELVRLAKQGLGPLAFEPLPAVENQPAQNPDVLRRTLDRINEFDRRTNEEQGTDISEVWDLLYAIRDECMQALGVKVWYVVGPDGMRDHMGAEYPTQEAAEHAKAAFVERFRPQGYYKTAACIRLTMEELEKATQVTTEAPEL